MIVVHKFLLGVHWRVDAPFTCTPWKNPVWNNCVCNKNINLCVVYSLWPVFKGAPTRAHKVARQAEGDGGETRTSPTKGAIIKMLWGESRGKGQQSPGIEPRMPLACAASALPLSYDARTTTNPHNPYVCPEFDSWWLPAFSTFLYFCLVTSKFSYYSARVLSSKQRGIFTRWGHA